MFTPLMEIEGTREEIIAQIPEMNGHRLHVSIAVEEKLKIDPKLKILQAIAAETIAANLPPDPRNYLREGRKGEMYGITQGETE